MRVVLAFLIALFPFTANAQQLTCFDLDGAYVYSLESPPEYLGFIGSQFASESIMNEFGAYGSPFRTGSVRNEFGRYGSPFGTFSANNPFAQSPPIIVRRGEFLAYLSTAISPRAVSLADIDSVCGRGFFTSSSPRPPVVFPPSSTIPPLSGGSTPPTFRLTDAYGGTFANPARAGEGAQITFGEVNGQRFLLIAAYTYDLNGNAMWLFGANPVPSDSRGPHRIDVVRTRGARFGQAFNPAEVVRETWGTVSVTFVACDQVNVQFNSVLPGFGSYSSTLDRVLPRTANAQCP